MQVTHENNNYLGVQLFKIDCGVSITTLQKCMLVCSLKKRKTYLKHQPSNLPFETVPPMSDKPSLVGYCGLYCGACAIYQHMIKNRALQLLEVLNAYQFREIAKEAKEWDPNLEYYPQFEGVLQSLMKMFGECPGCLAGGGPPVCVIRDCCKESGFSTCAECDKMPCDKLEPQIQGYRGHLAMLRRIREIGTKKWTEEMERKVKEGFSYIEVMAKSEK